MLRKVLVSVPLSESVCFITVLAAMFSALAFSVLNSVLPATDVASALSIASAIVGIVAIVVFRAKSEKMPRASKTLPNRSSAADWLQIRLQQRSEASRLGVLAVSVDLFDDLLDTRHTLSRTKAVEDVGRRMSALLREDDVLARGVTTDFLVCLSRVRPPQTETLDRLARRLQSDLQVPFSSEGQYTQLRLTIGMSSSRLMERTTALELLSAAEEAHEQALCSGPGTRSLYGVPSPTPLADADLMGELVNALENGQIIAWYQPQIETDTGRISGFEALARWEHPTRGVVSPATFLPLIEKAGLHHKLARVILTHALSALRTWDRAGLCIPGVGVNFTAEELRNPNLAEYLKWELDRFELQPSRLVVEVLETVIAESHEDAVAKNLREISSMGCRIDLDDFGTGFTSIINIRRFDVSRIKIDRKLVTGAGNDQQQRDLLAALMSMSEYLHVDTLGEGVETPEEQLALAQLGCGHVQGFAIARPMPLGDTLAWSADHQTRIEDAKAAASRSAEARFGPN